MYQMDSEPFIFDALDSDTDEIRLIELQPCDPDQADAQVACTMITAKLSDSPKYEALSYMWGSLDSSRVITVDERDFAVGENLWLALRQLRLGTT
jgi:hypothetical protein